MPQLLNLSRAARLAGVSRGQLQKKLRETNTETFEGQMTVNDLLALYPDINFERDPVFERLERLKQQARPKSEYSDGWLPDAEVLMTRLKDMHGVLARTRSALYSADKLLREAAQRLDGAVHERPEAMNAAILELNDWLLSHLESSFPEDDARAEIFARDTFYRILAPSVRLAASNHEFHVEGRDTILEAGLKAGLHISYGCSSGNCGACKSRVISGKVKQTRDHDYILSAREREEGYILACCWTAVTDLVMETAEALKPEDLPVQEIRTSVRKIESIAPDLALLSLRTPRTQTLRFMAGQSALLEDEDGHRARYPIASCPCDGGHLQFIVQRQHQSDFSASVLDGDLKGQVITLRGPEGDFVLQEESSAPALFIAIGVGFAPIKSLIEHAVSIDNAEWLHLYLAEEPAPVPYFNNQCRAWADALDNFRYTTLSAGAEAELIVGSLTADHASLSDCEIYVAGPSARLQPLADALRAVDGIDGDKLHFQILD